VTMGTPNSRIRNAATPAVERPRTVEPVLIPC
jgi:hypothetical protein